MRKKQKYNKNIITGTKSVDTKETPLLYHKKLEIALGFFFFVLLMLPLLFPITIVTRTHYNGLTSIVIFTVAEMKIKKKH